LSEGRNASGFPDAERIRPNGFKAFFDKDLTAIERGKKSAGVAARVEQLIERTQAFIVLP
jgi:hypothetical protein